MAKAGRPEIPASQRRNFIVRFVVTKEELVRIRAAAKVNHHTISDYLRSVAIPKP
jgi:hypothetical protein